MGPEVLFLPRMRHKWVVAGRRLRQPAVLNDENYFRSRENGDR